MGLAKVSIEQTSFNHFLQPKAGAVRRSLCLVSLSAYSSAPAVFASCFSFPGVRGVLLIVIVIVMHGRSCMTIDPRTVTMPGQSTSDFHRPGKHLLAPSAKALRGVGRVA